MDAINNINAELKLSAERFTSVQNITVSLRSNIPSNLKSLVEVLRKDGFSIIEKKGFFSKTITGSKNFDTVLTFEDYVSFIGKIVLLCSKYSVELRSVGCV